MPWLMLLLFGFSVIEASASEETSTAAQIQQKLATGETSAEQLVAQSLAAIETEAALNAFISVDHDGAKLRARELDDLRKAGEIPGPLHGIPVAVKDNIHVAGLPNTAGTAALRDFIPRQDAGVIVRLKAAGAIIVGKNNMHELAYGATSNNFTFGAVGNAHNPKLIPGGSSGGTAAAIASGMVTLGLGTDTGGSSRIPAALNGIVGFRPTTGRYPVDGLARISQTRDTVGPMAAHVTDIALLDSILSGEPRSEESVKLTSLRLGVPRGYFYHNLEPAVAKMTNALLTALKGAGVTLVEADINGIAELNEKVGFPIVLYETGVLLRAYIKQNLPGETLQSLLAQVTSPDVKAVLGDVEKGAITEAVYRDALEKYRPQLQQAYRDYFASHKVDAVIFPTTPLTARPIEGSLETVELNGQQVPTFPTYIRNTDPASNAGIPGLTLPMGLSGEGMPIGIEIDGPQGSDQRLLAIGLALETFLKQQEKEI